MPGESDHASACCVQLDTCWGDCAEVEEGRSPRCNWTLGERPFTLHCLLPSRVYQFAGFN